MRLTDQIKISNRNTNAKPQSIESPPNPKIIHVTLCFQKHTSPTPPDPVIISNRESLRLETPATQTKQRTEPRSNREKEPCFRRGGCFRPSHLWSPLKPANPNREPLRLETPATQTKQRTQPHSNREKEAWWLTFARCCGDLKMADLREGRSTLPYWPYSVVSLALPPLKSTRAGERRYVWAASLFFR
jgi:hypothetical protein